MLLQGLLKKKYNGSLKKRFCNTYEFFNHDNNKFILFFAKIVYRYGYMDG